jgi:hypothetical protein
MEFDTDDIDALSAGVDRPMADSSEGRSFRNQNLLRGDKL